MSQPLRVLGIDLRQYAWCGIRFALVRPINFMGKKICYNNPDNMPDKEQDLAGAAF